MCVMYRGVAPYLILMCCVAAAAWAGQADPQARAGQARAIHFGDIVLRGFERAEVALGTSARATGPNTTVDTVDEARKSSARLQAASITAYMAPKSANRVERVEAQGNVRFQVTRPASGGEGSQVVRGSGARAVYYRERRLLEMQGPITFSADEPVPGGGNGRQTVDGRADSAVYDEGKNVLSLIGDVQATVVTPQTTAEGSTFSGDRVDVDMSVNPYTVVISVTAADRGRVNIRLREPEPERGQGAPQR
ncbi:MAG TPA: hypothetical protein VLH79_11560 [Chthonomonadales bacterium]|nr:hypothetical protein [Chthonomonadales bacterium]